MKALVSVLIVEPSEIIFEGLRTILESAGGFNVLSPLRDTSLLEERLPALAPDVLILNPTMVGSMSRHQQTVTPRQLLGNIASQRPSMPVLALVYEYVESGVMDLFRFSIDIRTSRSTLLNTINNAIKTMANDDAEPAEQPESHDLSERETDVLVLVAKGLSSKEIADQLNISIHTVNSHRKNITHKTGIKSVAGLAVYAVIHNLM